MPDETPPIVLIRSAEIVVAWDERAKNHVYLSDADVAFLGGAVIFAGRGYTGSATETIDGRGLMVMPRLDGHARACERPLAPVQRADEQGPDR